MSRTKRRMSQTPRWVKKPYYGAHIHSIYCSNHTFIKTEYGQQQYDLAVEEQKLLEQSYHRDDQRWNSRRKRLKQEMRNRGVRSHVRQECQRVCVSGEYDTFDPS